MADALSDSGTNGVTYVRNRAENTAFNHFDMQVAMLQSDPSTDKQPRCVKCGAIMTPVSLIPGLSELSQHIFKCERCNRIEVLQETNSSPK
jgi:hypothetical protein